MWAAYRMYNTMLYMSLFWGFAKKSEAKVILHSSAMLKKIKGPFYLINCWKSWTQLWNLVVYIAKNVALILIGPRFCPCVLIVTGARPEDERVVVPLILLFI